MAAAQYGILKQAPRLPCPVHGVPVLWPENEIAWQMYCTMAMQHQFKVVGTGRQAKYVFDYQVVQMLLQAHQVAPEDVLSVLDQLALIQTTVTVEQ